MLADERVEPAGRLLRLAPWLRDVSFGTSSAVGAVAGLESFAYRAVGRQANLIRLLKEGREAEVEARRRMVEDGGCGGLGGGSCHFEKS